MSANDGLLKCVDFICGEGTSRAWILADQEQIADRRAQSDIQLRNLIRLQWKGTMERTRKAFSSTASIHITAAFSGEMSGSIPGKDALARPRAVIMHQLFGFVKNVLDQPVSPMMKQVRLYNLFHLLDLFRSNWSDSQRTFGDQIAVQLKIAQFQQRAHALIQMPIVDFNDDNLIPRIDATLMSAQRPMQEEHAFIQPAAAAAAAGNGAWVQQGDYAYNNTTQQQQQEWQQVDSPPRLRRPNLESEPAAAADFSQRLLPSYEPPHTHVATPLQYGGAAAESLLSPMPYGPEAFYESNQLQQQLLPPSTPLPQLRSPEMFQIGSGGFGASIPLTPMSPGRHALLQIPEPEPPAAAAAAAAAAPDSEVPHPLDPPPPPSSSEALRAALEAENQATMRAEKIARENSDLRRELAQTTSRLKQTSDEKALAVNAQTEQAALLAEQKKATRQAAEQAAALSAEVARRDLVAQEARDAKEYDVLKWQVLEPLAAFPCILRIATQRTANLCKELIAQAYAEVEEEDEKGERLSVRRQLAEMRDFALKEVRRHARFLPRVPYLGDILTTVLNYEASGDLAGLPRGFLSLRNTYLAIIAEPTTVEDLDLLRLSTANCVRAGLISNLVSVEANDAFVSRINDEALQDKVRDITAQWVANALIMSGSPRGSDEGAVEAENMDMVRDVLFSEWDRKRREFNDELKALHMHASAGAPRPGGIVMFEKAIAVHGIAPSHSAIAAMVAGTGKRDLDSIMESENERFAQMDAEPQQRANADNVFLRDVLLRDVVPGELRAPESLARVKAECRYWLSPAGAEVDASFAQEADRFVATPQLDTSMAELTTRPNRVVAQESPIRKSGWAVADCSGRGMMCMYNALGIVFGVPALIIKADMAFTAFAMFGRSDAVLPGAADVTEAVISIIEGNSTKRLFPHWRKRDPIKNVLRAKDRRRGLRMFFAFLQSSRFGISHACTVLYNFTRALSLTKRSVAGTRRYDGVQVYSIDVRTVDGQVAGVADNDAGFRPFGKAVPRGDTEKIESAFIGLIKDELHFIVFWYPSLHMVTFPSNARDFITAVQRALGWTPRIKIEPAVAATDGSSPSRAIDVSLGDDAPAAAAAAAAAQEEDEEMKSESDAASDASDELDRPGAHRIGARGRVRAAKRACQNCGSAEPGRSGTGLVKSSCGCPGVFYCNAPDARSESKCSKLDGSHKCTQ